MNILLVEDEVKIAVFIRRALVEQHYSVHVVHNGHDALIQAEIHPYNLIILDIMLPQKDGFTLCEELRNNRVTTPILILTVRNSLHDKVRGLNLGADDYLTKPFEIEELLARTRALLRRDKTDKSTVLKVADLSLNQVTQEVTRAGKSIKLTSREYTLLRYLMLHANEVVTRTMITDHVWGEDSAAFTNVIDVYINYIRNKVDKDFDIPLIHTVRLIGYTLKEPGVV
ncbi:MAG: response regulator transcription factor [wastewater metagenome]|nr:response regulator transcription factor [Candidatus Loosdrechtia aerotolerans]